MNAFDSCSKRAFDITCSFIGLLLLWWLILIAWIIARLETRSNGFFLQTRIGRYGRRFRVVKIKTMITRNDHLTTITCSGDARITKSGRFFRKTKIDELPQLWNILTGDMSFVGPRPDVPGYADKLSSDKKIILSVRPGITGPATLAYRDEEEILAKQENPQKYNDDVIYPDKVRINLEYINKWRFRDDLNYIFKTIFWK